MFSPGVMFEGEYSQLKSNCFCLILVVILSTAQDIVEDEREIVVNLK